MFAVPWRVYILSARQFAWFVLQRTCRPLCTKVHAGLAEFMQPAMHEVHVGLADYMLPGMQNVRRVLQSSCSQLCTKCMQALAEYMLPGMQNVCRVLQSSCSLPCKSASGVGRVHAGFCAKCMPFLTECMQHAMQCAPRRGEGRHTDRHTKYLKLDKQGRQPHKHYIV